MKAMVEMTARMINLEAEDTVPCCPHCEQLLNLLQPDQSLPNQLLATCDSCLRWYSLFGIGEESNQFLIDTDREFRAGFDREGGATCLDRVRSREIGA